MEIKETEINEYLPYLQVFFGTLVIAILITLAVARSLASGITKFFGRIYLDLELAAFFTRLIVLIIVLGGIGGAMHTNYTMKAATVTTLVWDSAVQLRGALIALTQTLIYLIIIMLLLYLLDRKLSRNERVD